MENRATVRIDIFKLLIYFIKRCWIIIICAVIGFGYRYWQGVSHSVDTFTASGTMYVYNGNPNLINYGYTSASDLSSAVKLMDTYLVVVKSNKVLDVVVERLLPEYPYISAGYISSTVSMGSVLETGVLRISCTTDDPQKSADICNAIMDVAPDEIIRVVSAGNIEIIDYAVPPVFPDPHSPMRSAIIGAMMGAVPPAAVLLLLFLLNQKIEDVKDLNSNYTLAVLSSLKRYKKEEKDPGRFLLDSASEMELIESYAKLRMNLMYTLVGKEKHSVLMTSGISGEGKTTICANLAISMAMSGKRIILVDADMRRGYQSELFGYEKTAPGLSNVLVGSCKWDDVIIKDEKHAIDILTAGAVPPNPAELLGSDAMHKLVGELEAAYDLILIDAPPINIVSDPLALSDQVAGAVFVVRQHFSDHREVKKALIQAELTGLNLLGFVFYGENLSRGDYYGGKRYYRYNRYYKNYEKNYDPRVQINAQKQPPEKNDVLKEE